MIIGLIKASIFGLIICLPLFLTLWALRKWYYKKVIWLKIILTALSVVTFISAFAYNWTNETLNNDFSELHPIELTTNQLNVLAIGDSVAAGMEEGLRFSDFMGASEQFYTILQQQFDVEGWYQNWAISGATSEVCLNMVKDDITSEEYIAMLEGNFEDWNTISGREDDPSERIEKIMPNTSIQQLMADADIIYINISGNDVLVDTILNMELDKTEENIDIMKDNVSQIIDIINELNPDVEIYVNQVFTPNMGLPVFKDYTVVANTLNNALIDMADEYANVYIIPTYEEVTPIRLNVQKFTDVHPSEQGYDFLTWTFLYSFYMNSNYIK